MKLKSIREDDLIAKFILITHLIFDIARVYYIGYLLRNSVSYRLMIHPRISIPRLYNKYINEYFYFQSYRNNVFINNNTCYYTWKFTNFYL